MRTEEREEKGVIAAGFGQWEEGFKCAVYS